MHTNSYTGPRLFQIYKYIYIYEKENKQKKIRGEGCLWGIRTTCAFLGDEVFQYVNFNTHRLHQRHIKLYISEIQQ